MNKLPCFFVSYKDGAAFMHNNRKFAKRGEVEFDYKVPLASFQSTSRL
jgi:hypothetical protein